MLFIILLFVTSCWTEENIVIDGTKQLLLSQIVWRHGDRSPTGTYRNDPYQEPYWQFGGGGFGQLSPTGMMQHVKLGKLIRKNYIDQQQPFLSNYYNSKEIYVRATDVNRTLISAMSNMIGMFGQQEYNNRNYTDYPADPLWPGSFIPVPVHTVNDGTDYIGNPGAHCQRQDKLWQMAKSSPELQAFQNSQQVSQLLAYLTDKAGENITIDNLWMFYDNLLIERIHCPDFYEKIPWYSDALYANISQVEDMVDLYKNGVYNQTLMMNGLDVGLEIQKARGGSMINDILMHMNIKLNCYLNTLNTHCSSWTNALKYYIYSAHDTTVYALLTALGIQSKVSSKGYPLYSAAFAVELWVDTTSQKPYFKAIYHENENATFAVVTSTIAGCPSNSSYCDLAIFSQFAARIHVNMHMDQWCNIDPTTNQTFSNNPSTIMPTTPIANLPTIPVSTIPPTTTTKESKLTIISSLLLTILGALLIL